METRWRQTIGIPWTTRSVLYRRVVKPESQGRVRVCCEGLGESGVRGRGVGGGRLSDERQGLQLQMGNRPTAVRWDGQTKWASFSRVVMGRLRRTRSWRGRALSPAKKFCEVLAEGPAAGLRDR